MNYPYTRTLDIFALEGSSEVYAKFASQEILSQESFSNGYSSISKIVLRAISSY